MIKGHTLKCFIELPVLVSLSTSYADSSVTNSEYSVRWNPDLQFSCKITITSHCKGHLKAALPKYQITQEIATLTGSSFKLTQNETGTSLKKIGLSLINQSLLLNVIFFLFDANVTFVQETGDNPE